jgi:hypothetical protein
MTIGNKIGYTSSLNMLPKVIIANIGRSVDVENIQGPADAKYFESTKFTKYT